TGDVWFYDHPLPEGRKNYTKTLPIQADEFQSCLAWWKKREDGERAWKWDFKHDHEEGLAKAKPHWDKAEDARQKAADLNRRAKELATRIAELREGGKPADVIERVTAERQGALAEAAAADQTAKEAQAAGDALYWPIFNLDRKNPRAKEDIAHLPPEKIAASIAGKVRQMEEILDRVRGLLGKNA
ncbi:MAG: SAM-dependent DNA methyltransferase, partial [bacterium]